MTQVTFRDDMEVELIDSMGSDLLIAHAAWVSSGKQGERPTPKKLHGFINRLFQDGHGTPFEYPDMIFYFEIPIFVDRQLVKYRLTTINGSSGRYSEVNPEFYVIPENRPVIQVGKTMDYQFEMGEEVHYEALQHVHRTMAEAAWQNYEQLLEMNVAKEVARMHLPVSTYGSMYFKINLRNAFNFLSQRMALGEEAAIPSHPQYEITLVADKVAAIVQEKYPIAWEAFVNHRYRKL